MTFSESDRDRLDWQLLRYSPLSVYVSDSVLEKHLSVLTEASYEVLDLDCKGQHPEALCKKLGTYFGFETHRPNRIGLDTFNDLLYNDGALTSRIQKDGGLVTVLRQYDDFVSSYESDARALLEILAIHSRIALMLGLRWIVILKVNVPDFVVAPLETAIGLNDEEILERSNNLIDWDAIERDMAPDS